MKIIKFKKKEKFKYKRITIIKNLILKIYVGLHEFEKKYKQRVRFNIKISTNPQIKPKNTDLTTILNYEEVIKDIKHLVDKDHFILLEDLAEKIIEKLFINKIVNKVNVKLEKLDILKETDSVGIEIEKSRY